MSSQDDSGRPSPLSSESTVNACILIEGRTVQFRGPRGYTRQVYKTLRAARGAFTRQAKSIRTRHPDALFMEVRMPGSSAHGLHFAKSLSAVADLSPPHMRPNRKHRK